MTCQSKPISISVKFDIKVSFSCSAVLLPIMLLSSLRKTTWTASGVCFLLVLIVVLLTGQSESNRSSHTVGSKSLKVHSQRNLFCREPTSKDLNDLRQHFKHRIRQMVADYSPVCEDPDELRKDVRALYKYAWLILFLVPKV